MDLDDFQNIGAPPSTTSLSQETALGALHHIDNVWYSEMNRRGRWMDLIGDYAGVEPFVIDGGLKFSFAHISWNLNVVSRRFPRSACPR